MGKEGESTNCWKTTVILSPGAYSAPATHAGGVLLREQSSVRKEAARLVAASGKLILSSSADGGSSVRFGPLLFFHHGQHASGGSRREEAQGDKVALGGRLRACVQGKRSCLSRNLSSPPPPT